MPDWESRFSRKKFFVALRHQLVLGKSLSQKDKRGSLQALGHWQDIIEDIRSSNTMHRVWDSYIVDSPYAKDASFEDVHDSIDLLMRSSGF